MEPILSVRNLSISFTQYTSKTRRHRLHVIDDLSLSVEAGQVVAVVGASGSGKSLLAHGILGILPYNAFLEGSIRYRGEALDQARAARLRGKEIVLVPQGVTYLDPLMKVGLQIRKGRRGETPPRPVPGGPGPLRPGAGGGGRLSLCTVRRYGAAGAHLYGGHRIAQANHCR